MISNYFVCCFCPKTLNSEDMNFITTPRFHSTRAWRPPQTTQKYFRHQSETPRHQSEDECSLLTWYHPPCWHSSSLRSVGPPTSTHHGPLFWFWLRPPMHSISLNSRDSSLFFIFSSSSFFFLERACELGGERQRERASETLKQAPCLM